MPAFGQFWGSFYNSPTPGPTPQGSFLLNIDMHRPMAAGCFVYHMTQSNSPFNSDVGFALDTTVTTNDGHRFIAFSEAAYALNPTNGMCEQIPVPMRNGVPFRLDLDLTSPSERNAFMGTWKNSWGEAGAVILNKTEAGDRVREVLQCQSWNEYKSWAGGAGRNSFAFRGQANSEWQLKTSLHRANRFDLWFYSSQVLPLLQSELEGAANAAFDRSNPAEFARLIALAQHHGFPTPLLDFTSSPYIAAYFAFAEILEMPYQKWPKNVRVYALDSLFRRVAGSPITTLTSIKPTIGIVGVSGLRNPRLYAQQGLFVFTNVELVEHLLTAEFYTAGQTFLRAIDIPTPCAAEAISDLAYMGISPGSLFPGIDGVCTKLKQRLLMGTL